MKKFKTIGAIALLILAWTVFVGMGFVNGYLLQTINSSNTPEGFIQVCKNRVGQENVGNMAIALIENGAVDQTLFHSSNQAIIDEHSAFPVASISKWVTSVSILRLVDQGKIDLDRPVDDYLTRWHLPESEFDNHEVTIRRLLSHSAGLVDDLGYNGFSVGEPLQTLEESLTLAADRGDYSEGAAIVGYQPGSQLMYSGASYTLLQLVIEEVSGQSFSDFIDDEIFQSFGMENSSFELADSSRVGLVSVYKNDGSIRVMNRFTAKAAASLMTSVSDLSLFLNALILPNPTLISKEMIEEMSSPQSYHNGFAYYGLGPRLYVKDQIDVRIIGHDGSGNNAINTAARVNLHTGDGIIILETGHFSFASDMADEWVFWKSGIADRVVMERNIPFLMTILVLGYLFIIGLSIWFLKKKI